MDPEASILPRPRPELKTSFQMYHGEPYWVYKDPLSLRYYRFNREEHFILEMLRRGTTLPQIKEAHRRQFKSETLATSDIADFVRGLISKNLVITDRPDRDELLFKARQKSWRGKAWGQVTNFMFFKIPLFDPDRFMNRIMPHLRFIWTKKFFVFYLLLIALAAGLVLNRWNEYVEMLHTSFFTFYNVPFLLMAMYCVWILHEFGHGLTCKNYGGEVHEIGLLFLVFSPFMYCNVTDSWTIPNKIHRMLVMVGGIMTELFIASLAAIVWYGTRPPGFIHSLSFNIMMVCSVSTLLFNANPLLKYDGYYIMMDLMEVPNLRQQSATFMRNVLVRYVLGGSTETLPEQHLYRVVFPLYAVCSWCYRWFIIFMILYGVYYMFEKVHLVWLGRVVVSISAVTMLVLPLVMGARRLVATRESMGVSNSRLVLLLAILIVVAGVVMLWPMEQHVTLNFVLEPARFHWVRADAPGRVIWEPKLREGRQLETQTLVARLDNPELMYQRDEIASRIAQTRIDIAISQNRGLSGQVEQLRGKLESLTQDQARIEEQIAKLEVKSPITGKVMTPDRVFYRMENQFIKRGTPLILIGDDTELEAKVWVPEKTLARIFHQGDKVDQKALLMLYAFPAKEFNGTVKKSVSRHREENMGEFGEKMALSNKVGGEVLTEYDPALKAETPVEAVYEVTIKLDAKDLPAGTRSYMSGRTRIDCGKSTLYQWTRDSLLRFISPDVRL
jgi:putative peptide zinc metalloprotease protein